MPHPHSPSLAVETSDVPKNPDSRPASAGMLRTLTAAISLSIASAFAVAGTDAQEKPVSQKAETVERSPEDPAMKALIIQLSNNVYTVRAKAMEVLDTNMTTPLLDALAAERWNSDQDPEKSRRAELLYRKHYAKYGKDFASKYDIPAPRNYPCYPWISSLPQYFKMPDYSRLAGSPGYLVASRYLKLAREAGAPKDGSPDWTAYRKATVMFLKDAVYDHEKYFRGNPGYEQKKEEFFLEMRELLEIPMVDEDERYRDSLQEKLPSLRLQNTVQDEEGMTSEEDEGALSADQVRSLLEQLGDSSYPARAKASAILNDACMDQESLLLIAAARWGTDLEVARRATLIMKKHVGELRGQYSDAYPIPQPKTGMQYPALRSLPDDFSFPSYFRKENATLLEIRTRYAESAQKALGAKSIHAWEVQSKATEQFFMDWRDDFMQEYAGHPRLPELLQQLFADMRGLMHGPMFQQDEVMRDYLRRHPKEQETFGQK